MLHGFQDAGTLTGYKAAAMKADDGIQLVGIYEKALGLAGGMKSSDDRY